MAQPTAAPAAASSAQGAPRAAAHRWRFHRTGGLDQVMLETGEDLANLERLDQKLWVALSCPTRGLELDPRTLSLLDGDGDGRIRPPELLGAIRFCAARLGSLDALLRPEPVLPLAQLDASKPEGAATLGAARQVLAYVGKPDASGVSPDDVADLTRVFEKTLFNGDGVVPAEAASDEATRRIIEDALACGEAVPDRSGKPGVDRKHLDAFFEELAKFEAWAREGEGPEVAFLGPATAAAWEAFQAVREKVDDYFARCRFAAVDPRAGAAMNRSEPDLLALAAKDLGRSRDELAAFPLARIEAGRPLPLGPGVNPAWSAAVEALRRDLVGPALGARPSLGAEEWEALAARFGPWTAWLARKQGASVEKLGVARVRAILAAGRAGVEALLERDLAQEHEAAAIADVARLVHYRRDLHTLLRNFVSFADFYDPARLAIFQAGVLILDGRACDLCVRVDDPAAHAALGGLSRMFIAYCECRRSGGAAMRVAACFTQGDSDYLHVGRNGIFYDRKGQDWDATVVRIVSNPISIRQAFFAPYKKLVQFIEEQVARFAAAKEKETEARLQTTAETTVGAAVGTEKPAPSPVDVGRMVGIIAALGVGVGAIGTLFGGFVSGFLELRPWWAKLVAVAGVVMLVSGPSMLIAWLKLRQRTLGPVLDANGWAVNGRVKVNIPLGMALTQVAALPPGARRALEDPYLDRAARTRRRILWLVVAAAAAALALAWRYRYWPFRS